MGSLSQGLALLLTVLVLGLAAPTARGASAGAVDQVHLTWQRDPMTTMTITWVGPLDQYYWVSYGRTPQADRAILPGLSQPLPLRNGSLLWSVELKDLAPGTKYYYRIGADHSWTPVASFATAPDHWDSTTFVSVGDMGTQASAWNVPWRVAAMHPNLVVLPGDLSYAEGIPQIWDQWFSSMQPVGRWAPLMAVPGNHEDEGLHGLEAYASRFLLPGMPDRLYYSFNYSNIHFVALDAHFQNYPYHEGWDPTQTRWLQQDLARASADPSHPWIVAYLHVPLFDTGEVNPDWLAGRADWGRLFDRYHVDLIITGHSHDYERTYPVTADAQVVDSSSLSSYRSPDAPIYIVNGGGGATLSRFRPIVIREPINGTGNGTGGNVTYRSVNLAPWSAVRAEVHELLKVTVDEGAMDVRAIATGDGSTIDHFTIFKVAPQPPGGLPREPSEPPATTPPPGPYQRSRYQDAAVAPPEVGGLPGGPIATPTPTQPAALEAAKPPPMAALVAITSLGVLQGVLVSKVLYHRRRSGRGGGHHGPRPRR